MNRPDPRFPRPVAALLIALAMAATPALATAQAATGSADVAQAEVRKVDREPPRLTLRHGEIKSLDMPPMTMVFRVQPPELIERVKTGDRIRFRAEKIDGRYTVTWIEAAP